jgi:sugar lactone lactonase YvrE
MHRETTKKENRIRHWAFFLIIFIHTIMIYCSVYAAPVRGAAGDLWADKILGQFDFSQDHNNEVNAKNVNFGNSVFVDNTHHYLCMWDSGNNRVLVVQNFETAVTGQGADIVLGQQDFVHSGCNYDSNWQTFNWQTSPNGFYSPPVLPNANCLCGQYYMLQSPGEGGSIANMAADSQGNLYVPDYFNNRVLRFNYPIYTNEPASYVWGQLDGTGAGNFTFQAYDNNGANVPATPTNQNLGFWPTLRGTDGGLPQNAAGVAIDAWGNLWVADSQNNRVLRFPNLNAPAPGVPSTAADVVLGQADFTSNIMNTDVNNLTVFPVLNDPTVLRVDISGNVYVGETSYNGYGRISIFQPTGTNIAGVPVYGNGYASYEYIAASTTQPMGIEIDPNMNSATEVGLWVIDHSLGAFHYKITWPVFSVSILQNFSTPEALYSPGVASNGDVYLSDYRDMSLLHYPAGSSSPDSLQIFSPPAGYAGTGNRIGNSGFYTLMNVVVASAPGSGITQLIAPDALRIHFWNMPANGPEGLTNGQLEDGYAGTSQPYVFTSSAGYEGEITVDSSKKYIWALNGFSGTCRIEAFSLPLPPPTSPEINPVAVVDSPLPVLGKSVKVSWTGLTGLTADPAGNLWITDLGGNRVMRVRDPMGTQGIGPIVDVVLGQPDPGNGPVGTNCNGNGTTCPGGTQISASTLNYPSFLQFDHHGDLYVSDHWLEDGGNFRILRFDAKSLPVNNTVCAFAIPADGVYGTHGSFTTTGNTLYDQAFWEMALNSDDSIMVAGTNSQASGGYPPVIIQNPRNGIMPAGTPDIPGAGDNPIGHLNDYGPQTYGSYFDSQDNLYAVDGNRSRILIYFQPFLIPTATPVYSSTPVPTGSRTQPPTATATLTSTPGCSGCANPQATYGTGVAGSANGQMDGNSQLAVGTTNSIESVYFADINNNRIDQFNAATGVFETYFTGVGALNPGGLGSPYGTAVSADGHYLFAACTNGNEIVKMDLTNSGVVVAVITVTHPVYVTLDNTGTGDVYSGTDSCVTRFHEQNPNSYVAVGVIGTPGVTGSGTDQLNGSYGVMVQDSGNTVYVADSRNNRIVEWTTANGGATYNYAATVFSGSISPMEMAPDPSHPSLVYVGTNFSGYAILNMSTAPMWTLVYQCYPEGQNSPGIEVDNTSVYCSLADKGDTFPKPYSYCLTPVYSGTWTPTITPTSTAVTGPTDTPMPTPTTYNGITCGSSSQWTVSQPSGVALDSSGNIYVVDDATNLIDVYSPGGTINTHLGAGHLIAPSAVAVDGNGIIYVTDEISSIYTSGSTQYRVDVFNSLTGANPGAFSTSWGTSASSTGLLEVPVGIAANNAGTRIYVADQSLEQIEIFDGSGVLIKQWGSAGAGGNGTFGYPVGLALDTSGNVYVADWYTNLVQVFDYQGNWIRQWDVTEGTGLLTAQFIAVSQNCLVYVTDGFGKVGVFDIYGNVMGTVTQANGQNFNDTEGIAAADSGNWYVADLGNEQITGFNPCPACPPPSPTFTPTLTLTPSPTVQPETKTSTPTISQIATLTSTPTATATSLPPCDDGSKVLSYPNPYRSTDGYFYLHLELCYMASVNVRIYTNGFRKIMDKNFLNIPANTDLKVPTRDIKANASQASGIYFAVITITPQANSGYSVKRKVITIVVIN